MHLLPLEEVVGLETGRQTVEKSGIEDGIHLMKTGEIEANSTRPGVSFQSRWRPHE